MPDWVVAIGIAATVTAFGLWLWWRLTWQAERAAGWTDAMRGREAMTKGKATQETKA